MVVVFNHYFWLILSFFIFCNFESVCNSDVCDADDEFCGETNENAQMYTNTNNADSVSDSDTNKNDVVVHISAVACGDRLDEVMTMVKSVLLISHSHIFFHIFSDKHLFSKFEHRLSEYENIFVGKFHYKIYHIQYPSLVDEQEWKTLFKPCATQRLFIPLVLTDIDSVIYVDSDVLFLEPVEMLWNKFNDHNSTQLSSMTQEHEEPSASWYNRFARHPYVHPYGINSGVMLMNLTRLRATSWVDDLIKYHKEYKYNLTWGDQDLINIFFHHHPEMLHILPCNLNFRPDHCMYWSTCESAEMEGVLVVHGNRGVFHNDNMPIFKAIYESISMFPISTNIDMKLMQQMLQNNMNIYSDLKCGKISHVFIKNYLKFFN